MNYGNNIFTAKQQPAIYGHTLELIYVSIAVQYWFVNHLFMAIPRIHIICSTCKQLGLPDNFLCSSGHALLSMTL